MMNETQLRFKFRLFSPDYLYICLKIGNDIDNCDN